MKRTGHSGRCVGLHAVSRRAARCQTGERMEAGAIGSGQRTTHPRLCRSEVPIGLTRDDGVEATVKVSEPNFLVVAQRECLVARGP